MTCPSRDQLERLFEGAIDDAALRAHAASCEPCGAHLRRLEEEARALKRNLPDVSAPPIRIAPPASNVWKPVALLAACVSIVLAGALIVSLQRRDEQIRNVEASVRLHLARNEPAKAAAALAGHPGDAAALRLDIARASEPADAAKVLEPVRLSALDASLAAAVAQARLDAWRRIFEPLVAKGVPTPFDLEPYRTAPQPPHEDLSRASAGLLAALADRPDPALESLVRVARYALGEIAHADVKADGWEFGDVLWRERQFDRAIAAWRPVASDPRVKRRLAELSALRRLAPKRLNVWDFDVDAHRDPAVDAEIEALYKRARPGFIPREGTEPIVDRQEDVAPVMRDFRGEAALDPTQLYLLVDHDGFRLSAPVDKPFHTFGGAVLKLATDYHGPIRCRLFRVRDIETLGSLNAETIVARRGELAPVAEWERQFAPLSENGREATHTLELPHREPGLYVVIAEARYCPVYAIAKFVVTDIALVQQPARDRVLVFAADRLAGSPVANLALVGEAAGQFVLRPEHLVPEDDSNAAEYKRGFEAAWADKKAEPDATASYLRGFQRAANIRTQHPDVKAAFKGATNADGLFEWMSAEWRPGYRYTIRTATADAQKHSRVESTYAIDAKDRAVKALVYTDRPTYRPGDVVHFKAILREFDGEGLHPYAGREALIEFQAGGRVVVAKTCPVTGFGTASGDLRLPHDAPQNAYRASVNNGDWSAAFHVEEYRKPEFQIAFDHPRHVRAGAAVEVRIDVRMYSGDPVADTKVNVELQAAGAAAKVMTADDRGWRTLEHRQLTTDSRGRCVFRFPTDEGASMRYAVRACAEDAARRLVVAWSGIEATATGVPLAIETDRPTYFPGETAILRFHAEGAAALRIEERATVEKPFSATVELKDGVGACEYPVRDANLQVAVRAGDEWVWTQVPIKIAAASSHGGLVSVRVDRSVHRVGETAKVEICSSEPSQHVLFVLATGRIHERRVVRLSDGKAEVPVPVGESAVPNVGVIAIAVRGDHHAKALAQILVPPVDRFLTVDVETDKPEYRPGEECRATLRVVDAKGRPVRDCEISLGVVDESVYAVREDATPDLREFFHRYERPIAVHESFFFVEKPSAFWLWKAPVFIPGRPRKGMGIYDTIGIGSGGGSGGRYGGRMGGRENLVARGGGARATEMSVRSDFRDTAFWSAHLTTDGEGRATASFKFPDNLTTFRFTARGITRDHKVGAVRQSAVVRKPFYTRIASPRVLQEGNTVSLAGLIHNGTGKAQTVRWTFGSKSGELTVADGEVARVEHVLSLARFQRQVELTFGARNEEVSDAVTIDVPGRRHGMPFQEGRSGAVAAGAPKEEVFRIPASRIAGTLDLKLNLDAGIHSAILEGLEPLIQYPYGCVEQTMSRFLPAVAADRALGDAPHRWKEQLPSVIASGLRRLYDFQHSDGGWGWWQNDATNDPMTAYVLYGLAACKRAGVGVDRAACDRAAKHLREHLEKAMFGREPFD